MEKAGTFVGSSVSRRTALRIGGGAFAVGLLARPSFSAAQDGTPAAAPPVTGPTFVGIADDGETFAAVVVEEPAFDGAERQVRAYLCDAARVDAWFKGATAHTAAELSADDGGTLTVELGRSGVTGTATLADGTELALALEPASGIAGLYNATVSEEGVIIAEAVDGGARLEGWVLRDPVPSGDDGDEAFPAAWLIVTADGTPQAILGFLSRRGASDQGRLIMLADGKGKGASKSKETGERWSWFWADF